MGKDKRDDQTWAVLELTRAGEVLAERGQLKKVLLDHLGVGEDHPIFIPSVSYSYGNKSVTICLMEGYAFVGSGLDDCTYFDLEQNCPYVSQVMTEDQPGGVRVLRALPNSDIERMKAQLASLLSRDLREGMSVEITDGLYARMEGKILSIDGDDAFVHISLRSMETIQKIPLVFLRPLNG